MSAKKIHGLGKGMGSLLGNFDFDITPDVVSSPKEKITVQVSEEDIKDRVLYVSVDKITPNVNQPRKSFDDDSLAELSASIKKSDISLEDALKDFEEGIKLAKSMEKSLDEMESKIQILMNNPEVSEEDEKSAQGKKQKSKSENAPVLGLFDESSEITGTRA